MSFGLVARTTVYRLRPSLSTKLKNWPYLLSYRTMTTEYKLKDVSTLDLKTGEKREVEVEGLENGKVLLARVGNETHALSANCTHYGAPLKNGVLTPDGRLTCPWHGGMSSDRLPHWVGRYR